MSWIGKIIGGIVGFLTFGGIGLVIGVIAGHLFDTGILHKWFGTTKPRGQQHTKVQETFFNTTFSVMGHIAKSDGRVSESEIQAARNVMNQMGLDDRLKHEAIRCFNEGKQANFNLDRALANLRQVCWYRPSLLRIFLEIQIQMAHAEGQGLSEQKKQKLQYICRHLGVMGFKFDQFEQRYRAEQNYQRQSYQQQSSYNPKAHLAEAYKLLGVSPSANPAEIKKAYRRLMSQHHPDKLMSRGLPPEMIKMATQKTQQIKKAYEQIRKARGF